MHGFEWIHLIDFNFLFKIRNMAARHQKMAARHQKMLQLQRKITIMTIIYICKCFIFF